MRGPWARGARQAVPEQLRVDPVACEGIGLCAHLAPDVVRLDQWGFPILGGVDDRHRLRQARAAAAACPRRALLLGPSAASRPAPSDA